MSTERPATPPLKSVDFLILLMLVEAPRHGYGIMLAVEAATEGSVRLDAGNLYRSLRKLLRDGYVSKSARRPAPESESAPESDDERRQYYELTASGRRAATAEARRIEGLLRLEPARCLLGSEPAP